MKKHTGLELSLMGFLENLPQYVALAPAVVSLIQNALAAFREQDSDATKEDIDALIEKIVKQSAEIQALD